MYLFTTYVRRLGHRLGSRVALVSLATVVTAAGAVVGLTGTAATASTRSRAATAAASGDVDVISAGSLDTLITKSIAPAFRKATGYTLVDTSGGSGTDATEIKNGIDVEDVFLSASPTVTQTLVGAKNGSWVHWYADFATSPYVLAYYPKSRFAHDLKTKQWWQVITLPGFRLGRTNPTQDPGGVLAVKALDDAASQHHVPALKKLATEASDEYEEDVEEADVQNGQLDASFMYESDALSQDSPFVKLTGTDLYGDYTVALLKNAPHVTAAEAFIKFLLGPTGQKLLKKYKFGIVSPPQLHGSGVPSALRSLFK